MYSRQFTFYNMEEKMNYQMIEFYEDGCWIRSIGSEKEYLQAYRLRHQVFCETLGWVPPNPTGLEIDRYDSFATLLGLFSEENNLMGLIRLLPPDRPFMLEEEFSDLMAPGYRIRKEVDTAEISRLAIAPSAKERGLSSHYLNILLKGLYQWALVNEIRYSYLEVEKRFWRILQFLGFLSTPIGPVKSLPPAGANSMAAILDWEAFRFHNRNRQPEFLDWITTVQSAPVVSPGQWRVHGLRPEVLKGYSGHENSLSVH
jgi:acyl homoserine lactone synthase